MQKIGKWLPLARSFDGWSSSDSRSSDDKLAEQDDVVSPSSARWMASLSRYFEAIPTQRYRETPIVRGENPRRPPPPIDTNVRDAEYKLEFRLANGSSTPPATFPQAICPPEGHFGFRRGIIAL
jgi:hypothetical protein